MDAPLRADRLIRDGREIRAFVGEYSKTRTLILAIGSALLALMGLLLIFVSDDGRIIGVLCLLFFGAGTVVLGLMVGRPGRVALSPDGIFLESRFAHAFAPWDAVTGVGRTRISGNQMLTIDVTDPSRLQTSQWLGWLKGLNRSTGMPDLAIPTSLLGSRADALEAAIGYYLGNPDARQRIGSVEELERLGAAIGPDTDGGEAEVRVQHPRLSRWILWVTGGLGLLLTIGAAFREATPGREGARIAGAVVLTIVFAAAVASAYLMTRRPRASRILGLVAAAGAVFTGWAVMQSASTLPGALVAIAIAAVGVLVAWQLVRWSPQKVRPA